MLTVCQDLLWTLRTLLHLFLLQHWDRCYYPHFKNPLLRHGRQVFCRQVTCLQSHSWYEASLGLKADCLAVVSKHRTVICRNLACISHFRSNFVLAHAVLAKEHHACPYMLSTPYDLPCRGLYRSYICVAIEICWWYGIIKLFCISLWELNQVGCFVWKSSSEFFLPVPWSVHSTEPIPAALI